jgi:hypothetical protein
LLVGGGGVQDALESLGCHPDDWIYRTAIITRAAQIDTKRRRDEIEALGSHIGAQVAKTVAKMLGG